MAEERNFCEEIEIAVFSGAELTKEQLNHIENCEGCRALLSQMTDLRKDLSSLSVTGIEDGKIADAVMESIKREKTAIPFPKFKITHHIGTAAAVVIILVAALMIKNPSQPESFDGADDNSTSPTVFDSGENNHILSKATGAEEDTDAADEIVEMQAEIALFADDGEMQEGEAEQPKLLLKAAPPKRAESESMNAAVESVTEQDDYYTDSSDGMQLTTNGLLNSAFAADEAMPEESEASGEGGSGSAYVESAKNWKLMLPALPNGMITAFDGIEFLHGEENFDHNIQLANARLYELYGKEHILTRELLSECGCTGNSEFLIFINDSIGYDGK